MLDSATLAAYVMQETLSPFTPYGPFSHLEGLINSLDASPLVPREHAQRFREKVTDAIHAEMLEYVEAGDWCWSIALYHQLRRTPSRASREQATEGLAQNGLEELRRLATQPEREPRIAYLELLEELVDFLLEQGAEDELPEEFAVVYGRAERVFALREAERNEWLQKHLVQRDPSERSDVARDHTLVTDLMRKLDDTR